MLTSKCCKTTGVCEHKLLKSWFVKACTLWFKVVNVDGNKLAYVWNIAHHVCLLCLRCLMNSILDRMFLGMRYKTEFIKIHAIYIYIYIYIYTCIMIPYRNLAQVGFEPTTSCLPCTRSNHWAIWPNDEMCLKVYRIKWPRS